MDHKRFFDFIGGGNFRSILALNGRLPDSSFFTMSGLPVIAVDGAANTLFDAGVPIEMIVGDLDSVREEVRAKHKTVHLPDQNRSDFQKALELLEAPAIVVGINGGYLDHILYNIAIFAESNCLFYDPPLVGRVLAKKETLELPLHTKISLFSMPEATISTSGLRWDLKRQTISSSCFNRTQDEVVTIDVHQGKLLAMIYLEPINDAGSFLYEKS